MKDSSLPENETEALLIARLDRLPSWPYPAIVLLFVGTTYLAAFFDTTCIGVCLPVFGKALHISGAQKAWPITSALIGFVLGSFVNSSFSDAYGRKFGITIATIFYAVGSIVAALASNLDGMVIGRLISGLGIGAEISVMSAYISELSPASVRGRYTSLANVFAIVGGNLLVPVAALFLLHEYAWGWRAMFFLSVVGALGLFTLPWIPESPRWLLSKNRISEASTIINAAEKRVLARNGGELPAPTLSAAEIHAEENSILSLLRTPYLTRLVLLFLLWAFWYAGLFTWFGLGPTFLVENGFTLTNSIVFLLISAIGYPIGSLVATRIGDGWERKYLIFISLMVWAFCFVAIGFGVDFVGGIYGQILICTILLILAFTVGFHVPLMYTLSAESFPTRARATGVGLTGGVGHIGGAVAPIFALSFYAWGGIVNGFMTVFLFIACTGVLAAIIALFSIKATGRPLELVSG
jgi:MFS transporter, putative metabolite:H+ symporter